MSISYLVIPCILFIIWLIYLFLTDLLISRFGETNLESLSNLLTTRWDEINVPIVAGLIDGPCRYAHKLSDLYQTSNIQILAFLAGSIAGIFLGPIEYYYKIQLIIRNKKDEQ